MFCNKDSFQDFGQILQSFNSHSKYKRPNLDVYLLDQVLNIILHLLFILLKLSQ
jgi:hypothetical protein